MLPYILHVSRRGLAAAALLSLAVSPLIAATVSGNVTYPGHEGLLFRAHIDRIEPEHTFVFRWCPFATDPGTDFSDMPTTTVEFRLEPDGDGTHLTITESGFDALPEEHRSECFIRNEGGWKIQVENITNYVDG